MNLERAAMKGRLEELKAERRALDMRCESLCRGIRQDLNTMLAPVTQLEVPRAAQQMEDLTAAWGELAALDSQISRLERELD